jgi:hypothetical protein
MDPNLPTPDYSGRRHSLHPAQVDPANDFRWLLEQLVDYLQTPNWTVEICEFIDDNCIAFAGELNEENCLFFTEIHQRFSTIVDLKLEEFCMNNNVTHLMFLKAIN